MEFGVGYFPTHDGIGPAELAKLVEERGQESLFFAEHTHIPASRESPWGGGPVLPQNVLLLAPCHSLGPSGPGADPFHPTRKPLPSK